ncbi:MAG: hypothetical protein V3W31_01320 [Thermodesulfobacteriota bacterium]
MKRIIAIVFSALLVLSSVSPALAGEINREPSGEAMIFDVLLVRPLGIVASVFGTGLFIVSLPFTIPTKSVKMAGKKLVSEPLAYTFKRPVGDTRDIKY